MKPKTSHGSINNDASLVIENVQVSDSGKYDCVTKDDIEKTISVNLNVARKSNQTSDNANHAFKKGQPLRMSCDVEVN